MSLYALKNKIWKRKAEDPLFVLSTGYPLDRKFLISWIREKAKIVKFPNWDKLNGISFRRGYIQDLQELKFNEYGKFCRWKSESCAKRYYRVNEKTVEQFGLAYDKIAMSD